MEKKFSAAVLITGILISIIFLAFLLDSPIENSWEENSIENYEKKITRPLLNIEENNGIVTNIWFHKSDELNRFADNKIKYLFVDVGEIDENGILLTKEPEIAHFIEKIENFEKETGYDFILLPYNEIIIENSETYDFTENFAKNLIKNHKSLIELGFDGTYIDVEAIPFDKRGDYLEFLEELGRVIGNEYMLAVSSGLINENPNIWEWGPDFYNAVSDRVDLILIPAYDLDLSNKEDYQEYVQNQVKEIASKEWNSKFMFIAPTHKQSPETIENSLESYKKETEKHEKNPFIGIAIFAEWTTDEREWEVFEEYI